MLAPILAVALQAAATTPIPTAEAEALGRRLAEGGTLGALLPLMIAKDTADMLAAHPELSAADKETLRAIAKDQAAAGMERLMNAEGHAFAAALSVDNMRVLVAAAESDAAKRQRAALPRVIMATMTAADGLEFKRDTLAAFCAKTGKACVATK